MPRIVLALLGVLLLPSASAAAENPILTRSRAEAPPQLFLALGANLASIGYHVNSKMPKGFVARTHCPNVWPDKRRMTVKRWARVLDQKRDCAALQRSYRTSVVRDEKHEGLTVVQEIWVWIYDSAAAAQQAQKNMHDMTLHKHPYDVWIGENTLVVLERRWRFKRFGDELVKYLETHLTQEKGWYRPADLPR